MEQRRVIFMCKKKNILMEFELIWKSQKNTENPIIIIVNKFELF